MRNPVLCNSNCTRSVALAIRKNTAFCQARDMVGPHPCGWGKARASRRAIFCAPRQKARKNSLIHAHAGAAGEFGDMGHPLSRGTTRSPGGFPQRGKTGLDLGLLESLAKAGGKLGHQLQLAGEFRGHLGFGQRELRLQQQPGYGGF
jgi:hypothetical protein